MTHLTINGRSTHVQVLPPEGGAEGSTPQTVVLVHGMLTDSLASYYFTIAPVFAKAGVEVVMFDHRGHGKTDRTESGYRLEEVVDDLRLLLDALDRRGPVHLVGNSYGGTIAYAFALEHPDRVASVATIESEPPTGAWAAKMSVNLAKARRDLHKPGANAWIVARYGAHTARLAKAALRLLDTTRIADEIPMSRTVADDAIAALPMPVLGIFGSKSDLAQQAPVIAGVITRGRSIVVPGREHSVLVEEPALCERVLITWVTTGELPAPDATASFREVRAG